MQTRHRTSPLSSLKEYRRKRNFAKTAEPSGKSAQSGTRHRFVIQKHAASRLHYDFRLEMDGTLKSWAVPKGIPFTKGEKRLAVQVEDHPVSYRDFEGTIPQGQYGGGTVMVWDLGTYEPLSDSPSQDLSKGKLHFVLSGKKLQGEWYLVQLRDSTQWLLIRGKADMRPVSKKMDDTSALSGKSMQQLAAGDRVWQSNRASSDDTRRLGVKKKREEPFRLGFVEPMKAKLVAGLPEGEWIYEIKLDGIRAIALKQGRQVRLISRNEKDLGREFPEVVEEISELVARDAIVDGEVVALDQKGRSSFQLLQSRGTGARPDIFYYAFDLLRVNGENLESRPLTARKAQLENLLKNAKGIIRYSSSLEGDTAELVKQASRLGLEGLIAKKKDSVYGPGKRSGAWVKFKLLQEQEMIIGGYTNPEGTRKYFGAVLVGYFEKNKLRFGGKVGTGFNEAWLKRLSAMFGKLALQRCPFGNLPEKRNGRYGQGITPSKMKLCHWVKPSLVCQVKFAEWTNDGKLRQPVFLGLREDKDPKEVVRETAAPTPL